LDPDPTPPRTRSIANASHPIPVQSGSQALFVIGVVALSVASFAAGFGGGFVVGQRSGPATESVVVDHHEPVAADPEITRAAVKDPQPIVATTQKAAPVLEEKASSSEPIAPTVARQPEAPAVEAGRLVVRSTPSGAGVVIDGHSRGVTPLDLRELPFGARAIEISHPGHVTRKQRVTLSERRPSRTVDIQLRPMSALAPATPATSTTGSLHVASRPSGAQVFVDDNLIGTTPLLLSGVAAGSRSLRIELSGYRIWTTSVHIKASARSRVSASLEQ
jgi:hypothetical protein